MNISDKIAEAFIKWPLPESVNADLCATKQGPGRIGTNLLSYDEAHQMAQEVVLPIVTKFINDASQNRQRDGGGAI